jgi:hypothetical protein
VNLDLPLSILLLAAFIVGVNFTMEPDDNSFTNRLASLFPSHGNPGWPTGVQEDDDHRWRTMERAKIRPAPGERAIGDSPIDDGHERMAAAEIIDGPVQPAPVSRVRRIG